MNTCLSIQGHLIIDRDFTITGGEIIMLPGAQITVNGSRTFTLMNVNENGGVHGCTAMWSGIRALTTSAYQVSINIIGSIIQDARHAVLANKRTHLGLINSSLIDNWFGILIPDLPNDIPPVPFNLTLIDVKGSRLSAQGPLLPPYPGFWDDEISAIAAYVFRHNRIGIFAANANISVGTGANAQDKNVFEYLNAGVFGINTGLTIRNNAFQKIGPMELNTLYEDFYHGIHSENAADNKIAIIIGNAFKECQVGIYSRNTHLRVVNRNMFERCAYGTVVRNPASKNVRIDNNEFSCGYGVMVRGEAPAQSLNIVNNVLSTPVFPDATGFGGITVYGSATLFTAVNDFRIFNNVINSTYNSQLPNPYALSSITTWRTRGLEIAQNTMKLQWGNGIMVASAIGTRVENNRILQSGYPVIAATIADSPNTLVSCNRLEGHNEGLIFSGASDCTFDSNGNAYCTNVRTNLLKNPGGNTLVLYNAIISPQIWKGNQWEDVDPPGSGPFHVEAHYLGDALLTDFSRFTVHTMQLPYHPQYIYINGTPQTNNEWFNTIPSTQFDACNIPPSEFGDGGPEAVDILKAYAQGALAQASYGIGSQWIAERHTYRNLSTAPGLLSHATLQSFYQSAQAGSLDAFYRIEDDIERVVQMPQAMKNLLDSLQGIQADQEQLMRQLWSEPEPVEPSALQQLQQARTQAAQAYDAVTLHIANLIDEWADEREQTISELQQINTTIVPEHLPAQYLKAVMAVQLGRLANGGALSESERALLAPIAALCPAQGGDAVYIARSLLSGIHQQNTCVVPPASTGYLAPPNLPMQMPAPAEVAVYPNPGREVFFVTSPATASGQVEVVIYSLAGAVMHRAFIPAGGAVPLRLSSLPGGLYLYELKDEGTRLTSGKLVKKY